MGERYTLYATQCILPMFVQLNILTFTFIQFSLLSSNFIQFNSLISLCLNCVISDLKQCIFEQKKLKNRINNKKNIFIKKSKYIITKPKKKKYLGIFIRKLKLNDCIPYNHNSGDKD